MHLYRTITCVTVLFLFCFLASWAQQPFGITTSVGNSVAITICDGDTVTFTLEQSSSPAFDYEFIRIRNGITTIIEHNQALTNAFTLPGTYNGTYWEINDLTYFYISEEAQFGEFSIGVSQQISNVGSLNLNNIGMSIGLSMENFDFGVLYNFPVRNPDKVFSPSIFELYLTFDFSKFRRNQRGLFKRINTDNYF